MASKPTRVLLTLDCGDLDVDALKVITALVEHHDLHVTGLFVEDEDLLNAARLPGMSEVSVTTGEVLAVTRDRIEAQIVSQARRVRRQFESSASRLDFKHSFQVLRGRAIETVIQTAASADVVVISRALLATGLRSRTASNFAPLIRQRQNFLFLNEPWATGKSIIVLCESGYSGCERALTVARRIADIENIELVIAAPAAGRMCPVEKASSAEETVGDRVVVLESWSEDALGELCENEDARLLVVPPTENLDWQKLVLSLVDRAPCSLLRLA